MTGFIISGILFLVCIILIIKIIQKQKIDTQEKIKIELEIEDLKKLNSSLEKTNTALYEEQEYLQNSISQFTLKKNDLDKEVEKTQVKRDEIEKSIEVIRQQAKNTADKYLKDELKLAEEKIEIEKNKIKESLQKNKEEYNEEYLSILKESSKELEDKITEIIAANNKLEELQKTISTAIELEQRKQADEMAEQKYKISLSSEDLIEIKKLREVAPFLRNPRPVYKIIWEGYYRNPTNDLINRVIGLNDTTGIYRLTNTINNMEYIGQATNISDRWKQHIKCGLGIDTPNSLLYKGMLKNGVENFKFEIVEECPREKLNEREKHWIKFYKTEEYGYNMTKGNK